jgi:AGZA family xanthine/uracil permease-like MFS transporter
MQSNLDRSILERCFRLRERQSSVRAEVLGGLTTFAAMAYIIVINPAVLANAGLPPEPSTVATALAAAFGCLLMGLYANRPFAVAPYMGENAFIAFTLYLGMQIPWQQSLAAVFLSGVLFLVLTLLGARTWLAGAISPNLKHSFAIGIGLFLLFIGLYETGIVTSAVAGADAAVLGTDSDGRLLAPPVPVRIGDFGAPKVQLAVGGFALMVILTCWRFRGAILVGIVATAIAGYFAGVGAVPEAIHAWPWSYRLEEIAFQLDLAGVFRVEFFPVLLTLFLMSFLDTLGTMYALGSAGGMLDKQGNLPGLERPMVVDSLACMFSALIGTSTSGAFIESATGIREGARTGLAAVVSGLLFFMALFFLPLLTPLQQLSYAYGPALMLVGVLMFASARHLEVDDFTELAPAVISIVMTVFTYNIANGLTAGLILHPVLKLATFRWRAIHPGAALLGGMCLLYYVFGRPH